MGTDGFDWRNGRSKYRKHFHVVGSAVESVDRREAILRVHAREKELKAVTQQRIDEWARLKDIAMKRHDFQEARMFRSTPEAIDELLTRMKRETPEVFDKHRALTERQAELRRLNREDSQLWDFRI